MPRTISGIPFQLPDVGLREVSGRLYLDEDFLVFDVEDALAGEFDKEVHVIKVDPAALDAIRLERGLVRDRLFIRPRKSDLLTAMPGKYGVELPLKIWRKHRQTVLELIEEIARRGREEAA
jgi:hypothetical protein